MAGHDASVKDPLALHGIPPLDLSATQANGPSDTDSGSKQPHASSPDAGLDATAASGPADSETNKLTGQGSGSTKDGRKVKAGRRAAPLNPAYPPVVPFRSGSPNRFLGITCKHNMRFMKKGGSRSSSKLDLAVSPKSLPADPAPRQSESPEVSASLKRVSFGTIL